MKEIFVIGVLDDDMLVPIDIIQEYTGLTIDEIRSLDGKDGVQVVEVEQQWPEYEELPF